MTEIAEHPAFDNMIEIDLKPAEVRAVIRHFAELFDYCCAFHNAVCMSYTEESLKHHEHKGGFTFQFSSPEHWCTVIISYFYNNDFWGDMVSQECRKYYAEHGEYLRKNAQGYGPWGSHVITDAQRAWTTFTAPNNHGIKFEYTTPEGNRIVTFIGQIS